jgi:hypothetical protein
MVPTHSFYIQNFFDGMGLVLGAILLLMRIRQGTKEDSFKLNSFVRLHGLHALHIVGTLKELNAIILDGDENYEKTCAASIIV